VDSPDGGIPLCLGSEPRPRDVGGVVPNAFVPTQGATVSPSALG